MGNDRDNNGFGKMVEEVTVKKLRKRWRGKLMEKERGNNGLGKMVEKVMGKK